MKNEYYLGTEKVSQQVYETIQMYKENNLSLADENNHLKKALEKYRNYMDLWYSGHSVDFSKVRFEFQNLLPDPVQIMKKLNALEIIKNKCMFFSLESDEDNFCPKGHYRVYDNELYQFNELTKEEYDLLKEILK